MKHIILPKQAYRTIHTSAIFDSGPNVLETRADAGVARSTFMIEAVHDCAPISGKPSIHKPFCMEGMA